MQNCWLKMVQISMQKTYVKEHRYIWARWKVIFVDVRSIDLKCINRTFDLCVDHANVVTLLIANGVDVNAKDEDECTPLYLVARHSEFGKFHSFLKMIKIVQKKASNTNVNIGKQVKCARKIITIAN